MVHVRIDKTVAARFALMAIALKNSPVISIELVGKSQAFFDVLTAFVKHVKYSASLMPIASMETVVFLGFACPPRQTNAFLIRLAMMG